MRAISLRETNITTQRCLFLSSGMVFTVGVGQWTSHVEAGRSTSEPHTHLALAGFQVCCSLQEQALTDVPSWWQPIQEPMF